MSALIDTSTPAFERRFCAAAGSALRAHRAYQQFNRLARGTPAYGVAAEMARNMREDALQRARSARLELYLRRCRGAMA